MWSMCACVQTQTISRGRPPRASRASTGASAPTPLPVSTSRSRSRPRRYQRLGAQQLVHVGLGEHGRPPGHPREAEPVGGDGELGSVIHAVILPGRPRADANGALRIDWPRADHPLRPALGALVRVQRHVLAAGHARDAGAHADGLGAGDRRAHHPAGRPASCAACRTRASGRGAGLAALAGVLYFGALFCLLRGLNVGDLGPGLGAGVAAGRLPRRRRDPAGRTGHAAPRRRARAVRGGRGAHLVRGARRVHAGARPGPSPPVCSSPA